MSLLKEPMQKEGEVGFASCSKARKDRRAKKEEER